MRRMNKPSADKCFALICGYPKAYKEKVRRVEHNMPKACYFGGFSLFQRPGRKPICRLKSKNTFKFTAL